MPKSGIVPNYSNLQLLQIENITLAIKASIEQKQQPMEPVNAKHSALNKIIGGH